jgi:hypothetical protein
VCRHRRASDLGVAHAPQLIDVHCAGLGLRCLRVLWLPTSASSAQCLDLSGNQLGDGALVAAGLEALAPSLTSLDLSDNQVRVGLVW